MAVLFIYCGKIFTLKKLLLLLSFFISISAISQTISGYVYDEAQDMPLEGAFVYLDGTTFSATTDSNGFFTINAGQKYNAAIIVKYIGYKTFRVEDPFSYEGPFKVLMREDAIDLEAVVVNRSGGPFTRREMLKVFREEFLGKSRAGESCKIENEDDIRLYYDTQTQTLYAEADKPLKVRNKRLQYDITFDLVAFQVNYRSKSLNPYHITSSFFAGSTFFTDVSKNKEKAAQIRNEAYLGSTVHLLRTIANEDWEKQNFQLFKDGFIINPKKYLSVSDSIKFRKVTLIKEPVQSGIVDVSGLNLGQSAEQTDLPKTPRFGVLYNNEEESFFEFTKGHFYVDENGLFFPITELVFGGVLGQRKAGDLLPADYKYEE